MSSLTIHCLGILQSKTGSELVTIDWPENNSIEAALAALESQWPALASELPRCACAIGDELVPRTQPLQAGEELVLLPPVGGG